MRFFTPGPTHLGIGVAEAMQQAIQSDICCISHRSKDFEKLFAETTGALSSLMAIPKDYQIFFLGSATEAWERIIQNCSREKTAHFVNGAFSDRFHAVAKELGRTAVAFNAPLGQGFDFTTSAEESDVEVVCLTQNETSTGVWLPPDEFATVKLRCPRALVAIDIVSSAPIVAVDWPNADCVFFSVQKCFGLPAGLGVLVVSPRAMQRARDLEGSGRSIGSYHSFISLADFAGKNQTPETPNVLGIYLLRAVTKEFLNIGIDSLRASTLEKSQSMYTFFSRHERFKPFVTNEKHRSPTVLAIDVGGEAKALIHELERRGFALGSGYGSIKDRTIRIANFPMHSPAHVQELLAAFPS